MTKVQLKPEGKTSFDDLTELKDIQPHSIDKYSFSEAQYPGDFFYNASKIPENRQSGEEEYTLKTAALEGYTPEELTSVYELPMKVPAHHFIFDNQAIKRYENYNQLDEKDPEVFLENGLPIED